MPRPTRTCPYLLSSRHPPSSPASSACPPHRVNSKHSSIPSDTSTHAVPAMRTLFSENILSPKPTPGPEQKANPFELIFNTGTSSGPSVPTSSTASSHSSPKDNDWLTAYYREQRRLANQVHIQSNSSDTAQDAASRPCHRRRHGNPKVLFMGMRRYGAASSAMARRRETDTAAEAANPPFRKSYSKSSLLQRHFTSLRPNESKPRRWSHS